MYSLAQEPSFLNPKITKLLMYLLGQIDIHLFSFHFQGVANFTAVYKILWQMIKDSLLSNAEDPLSRHERSLANLSVIQKKVKHGRYRRKEKGDVESRIDPVVSYL